MGDREPSADDGVFEYTGVGCSVPEDVTSVRFIDGLQKIGDDAFYGCSLLAIITLPSTVTETGINAFCGCSNLREVTLNNGLQKIGDVAFSNCTLLESIKLPPTVVDIGYCAFNNCQSLESITLPSTLVEIGNESFQDCCNLREVELNEGLQKIGDRAFHVCTSLESIALPSTLTDIGMYAFAYCRNLREIEMNGVPQFIRGEVFSNCDALERFLFPTISYRLENLIQTSHWEGLEDELNEVHGVVQWESDELFVPRSTHQNWDETTRDLGKITQLISHYELKEATSTFELALWKSKLDQADASSNATNRAAYRIEVPGPVKDTLLQYILRS